MNDKPSNNEPNNNENEPNNEPKAITIGSDDPSVRHLVASMQEAATVGLRACKLDIGSEDGRLTLTVALACLVWESAGVDKRVPVTVVRALMNLAVDGGMAEAIGLNVAPGTPSATVQ